MDGREPHAVPYVSSTSTDISKGSKLEDEAKVDDGDPNTRDDFDCI